MQSSSGISLISLPKGLLANVAESRDRFTREAILEQCYFAFQVADFLACHPYSIRAGATEELVDIGESDTDVVPTGSLYELFRLGLQV